MEKFEWRETFNRQPVHFIFFDFSEPVPINSINNICQVIQNLTALSISLKGSCRFNMLAVYALSGRTTCIFPLQSVKYNFMKLQISLETMQNSHMINNSVDTFETLTEILQDVVKQYETYFQNAVLNSEEWPQIQMIFFSSQKSQNFVKIVQKALPSIHMAYISRAEIVILRSQRVTSSSNSSLKVDMDNQSSPGLFENDSDSHEMIASLIHVTETDANVYQIESIMKQWLHDYSTDSDHLRLNLGNNVIRCDIKECVLNADALPVNGQFHLLFDGSVSQSVVRPVPANKQNCASKVPIYTMDAIAVVQKEGLCESVLFGQFYVATATRCWKVDWNELDHNQQFFQAVARHLHDKNQVLIAKKSAHVTVAEKMLPSGFFAFFPAKNMLLIKSVAPSELLLPNEEVPEKDITHEVVMEAKESLENLEHKAIYNPLTMMSGLYSYLTTSQTKKMRPTTSFVTPIVSRNEDRVEGKRKRKGPTLPTAETGLNKQENLSFKTDFMTASAMLKRKFPQEFE